MVLFLYWKLYFITSGLVHGNRPIVWYQKYYLHLQGPLLIIVDALLFHRSFTNLLKEVCVFLFCVYDRSTKCVAKVQRNTGPTLSLPE